MDSVCGPSDEELGAVGPQEILRAAGIPEGLLDTFAPDELAPPVDTGTIRALLAGKLSEERQRITWHRIVSFRSWREAYRAVLRSGTSTENDPLDANDSR